MMSGKFYKKNMERKIKQNGKKDRIKEILSDDKQITETLQCAVREAVAKHKRAGNSIVSWQNGKVVLIKTNN